jgi:putative transposase
VREAGCLRAKKPFQVIREAIRGANASGRIRVIHYSVQGNHLHLIVEAVSGVGLSRGMQGLNIRIARAINGLLHRIGPVLSERYHRHDLTTPREIKNAIRYVIQNFRKHSGLDLPASWIDPCCSAGHRDTVLSPKTWLLSRAWRRSQERRGGPPPFGDK